MGRSTWWGRISLTWSIFTQWCGFENMSLFIHSMAWGCRLHVTWGDNNSSELYEWPLYFNIIFFLFHMLLFVNPFLFWIKGSIDINTIHWLHNIFRGYIFIYGSKNNKSLTFFFVKINLLWPRWKSESNENYINAICGQMSLYLISSLSSKVGTVTYISDFQLVCYWTLVCCKNF